MKIPHLFSKIIVWWCILIGTAFCFDSFFIMHTSDKDPSATLAVVLGFLGGELLFLALRNIFKERGHQDEP